MSRSAVFLVFAGAHFLANLVRSAFPSARTGRAVTALDLVMFAGRGSRSNGASAPGSRRA